MSDGRINEIIPLAARMFREKGYVSTSVQDISGALGLTKGALYHHFSSKEELLLEIMLQGISRTSTSLMERLQGVEAPSEQFRIAVETHLACTLTWQDYAVVIFQNTRYLSPKHYGIIKSKRTAYEAVWRNIIGACKEEDLWHSDLDETLTLKLVLGSLNNVAFWYQPEGAYSASQITHSFLNLFRKGLFNDEP